MSMVPDSDFGHVHNDGYNFVRPMRKYFHTLAHMCIHKLAVSWAMQLRALMPSRSINHHMRQSGGLDPHGFYTLR